MFGFRIRIAFLLIILTGGSSVAQILVHPSKIPASVKAHLVSLYPGLNADSIGVWWWMGMFDYPSDSSGYTAEFLYRNDRVRIYMAASGNDSIDSWRTTKGRQNVPKRLVKYLDSIYPNAYRIFWQGNERLCVVNFSLGKNTFDSLARRKEDEAVFDDSTLVSVILREPDSTSFPHTIKQYLDKYYSNYRIWSADREQTIPQGAVMVNQPLKYYVIYILKKKLLYGKFTILLFDNSGNFIKILHSKRHKSVYHTLE